MAWNYSINIKQYLNEYDDDGGEVDIVTVAENVAKELKTVPPHIFGGLPDKLVQVTRRAVERVPDDKDYHNVVFNRTLDQIYNAADEYRVWLGLL